MSDSQDPGRPAAGPASPGPAPRAVRPGRPGRSWRPPPLVRPVLLGVLAGAAFGLVFGLASLNRPVLNAVAFYLLCAAAGGLVGLVRGLALEATRRRDERRLSSRAAPGPHPPRR